MMLVFPNTKIASCSFLPSTLLGFVLLKQNKPLNSKTPRRCLEKQSGKAHTPALVSTFLLLCRLGVEFILGDREGVFNDS